MSDINSSTAKAIEKLNKEKEANKKNQYAEIVLDNLIERVKGSEALAEDVLQEHKTWDKCSKYIYNLARKQQQNGMAVISDDVVYEWAEDYFHLDDKAQAEKETREKAAADARKAEAAKKSEKKPEVKVTKSYEKSPENEKNAQKNTENVQKPTVSVQKSKKEIDGQLDIFSMLGM